jgi:amino acid permease
MSAFGIITFAFCGHMAFPTFQHDMENRGKFSLAIVLGYIGMSGEIS